MNNKIRLHGIFVESRNKYPEPCPLLVKHKRYARERKHKGLAQCRQTIFPKSRPATRANIYVIVNECKTLKLLIKLKQLQVSQQKVTTYHFSRMTQLPQSFEENL